MTALKKHLLLHIVFTYNCHLIFTITEKVEEKKEEEEEEESDDDMGFGKF